MAKVKLGKESWTIDRTPLDGLCEPNSRFIYIAPGLEGSDLLETCAHETLHAMYPEWSERQVERTSRRIARVCVAAGLFKKNRA